MYYFKDNWAGDIHHFDDLRAAKKEAQHHTCGHPVVIFHKGEIVKIVPPKERPFP